MDSNSPYDIFTESLLGDWKQEGKARAEDAVLVSKMDEVEEQFSALQDHEKQLLLTKLLGRFNKPNRDMIYNWANKEGI